MLTSYDIPWSRAVQCIGHGSLVWKFDWVYISLRLHPVRHEHGIVTLAPYPNLRSPDIVASSVIVCAMGGKWNEVSENMK